MTRVVVRDLYSGAVAHRMMSTIMMLFGLAPAVAPIVGGIIVQVADWRAVFGVLVIYAVILVAATIWGLPESLPKENRQPMHIPTLAKSVWTVARSLRFQRMTWVFMLSFQAFFMYIAGAALIVVDLFGLGAGDFWQLFVPLISGFVIGAFISGRVAAKFSRTAIVSTALLVGLAGSAINITVSLTEAAPLPVAMIGPAIIAGSVAAVMPAIQLITLDFFPNIRGSVSSVTTCQVLALNALFAGVVIETMAGHMWHLAALGMACLIGALVLWFMPGRADCQVEAATAESA